MKKALIILRILLFTSFCVTTIFAQKEVEKNYALLLDNSGSMRGYLERVINIGKAVGKEFNTNSSISLYGFESAKPGSEKAKGKLFLDWNNNNKLNESINSLYIVSGNTTLYDLIFQAAKAVNLKSEDSIKNSEKILIIITDGEDRASEIKKPELVKYLKESRIKVLIVGLITKLSIKDRFVYSAVSSQSRAKTFLTGLAEETGGRVIFSEEGESAETIAKYLLARKLI